MNNCQLVNTSAEHLVNFCRKVPDSGVSFRGSRPSHSIAAPDFRRTGGAAKGPSLGVRAARVGAARAPGLPPARRRRGADVFVCLQPWGCSGCPALCCGGGRRPLEALRRRRQPRRARGARAAPVRGALEPLGAPPDRDPRGRADASLPAAAAAAAAAARPRAFDRPTRFRLPRYETDLGYFARPAQLSIYAIDRAPRANGGPALARAPARRRLACHRTSLDVPLFA